MLPIPVWQSHARHVRRTSRRRQSNGKAVSRSSHSEFLCPSSDSSACRMSRTVVQRRGRYPCTAGSAPPEFTIVADVRRGVKVALVGLYGSVAVGRRASSGSDTVTISEQLLHAQFALLLLRASSEQLPCRRSYTHAVQSSFFQSNF